MLSSMRTGLFSKLFFGMLILAGAGLVLTDWSGTLRSGVGATDVARVGKERISLVSFDRLVRANLEGLSMGPPEAYKMGLIDGLLRNIANQKLLVLAASEAGLRVGDEQMAQTLSGLLEPYRQQGMEPKEALNRLASMAGGERALFNEIRTSETVALFQGALSAFSSYTPESLSKDFARIASETRKVKILNMQDERVKLSISASDADLEEYYQLVKNNYAVSERRAFTVAIVDADKVKDSIKLTDEAIANYYDDHKDNFKQDETYVLEMIVAPEEKQIETIAAALKENPDADMEALASENDLATGWQKPDKFAQNDLPQSFFSVLKGKKTGELAGPVQTAFGWHMIRINERNAARPRPLAEVSAQIKEQLIAESASSSLEHTANQLDDRLAGDESFEEIAASMPLKLIKVELMNKARQERETLKDFSATDQLALLKAAYEMDEHEAAPIFPLANGSYATVYVERVIPSSVPSLKDIRSSVEKAWLAQQREKINRTQAQTIIEEMEKNGFDAAAKKANGAVVENVTLSRHPKTKTTLDQTTVDELFAARPGVAVQIPSKGGIILAVVEDVSYPDSYRIEDEDNSIQIPVIQTIFEQSRSENGLHVNRGLLDRTYGQPQE